MVIIKKYRKNDFLYLTIYVTAWKISTFRNMLFTNSTIYLEPVMILTSNFVQRLSTTKSLIWRQYFRIMALCRHFVTPSAFVNSFCWFPTSIKRSSGPGLFQDILLREKMFLIFLFLPFFSMKDFKPPWQNIASVKFSKRFVAVLALLKIYYKYTKYRSRRQPRFAVTNSVRLNEWNLQLLLWAEKP